MMNCGISAQHVLHGSDGNKSSSCSGVIFVISINVIKRVGRPPIGIYSGGGLPKNNFIIGCDNITVGCAAEGNGKGLLSPVGWNCPQSAGTTRPFILLHQQLMIINSCHICPREWLRGGGRECMTAHKLIWEDYI